MPLAGSFDSESWYVTFTVDFALPSIRRCKVLAQAGGMFCAGLASIMTVAAAPRSPINGTVVAAGTLDRRSTLSSSIASLDLLLRPRHETWRYGADLSRFSSLAKSGTDAITDNDQVAMSGH